MTTGQRRRSLLLVAYTFSPSAAAGAQRPMAMAKYLRRLGHRVTVLTTAAYGWAAADANGDVSRTTDLRLLRARLRGRGVRTTYSSSGETHSHPSKSLAVPDRVAVTWVPFAVPAALRLHAKRRFDAVVTTSPPHSAHLVGRALSSAGCAWVADLRDGWTFEPVRPPFATELQRRLDAWLERRTLRAADVVTCVADPVADDLRRRVKIAAAVVPNGYDPELAPSTSDLAVGVDRGSSNRLSIVYTGRFGGYGREPGHVLAALRDLAAMEPRVAERLELVIAGPLLTDESRRLDDLAPIRVSKRGVVSRREAMALQRSAGALLLLASPERTQLANLKLFEYLASGRPIIGLAGGTEAGRILQRAGVDVVRADDREAIKAAFRRAARDELSAPDAAIVQEYVYPAVAQRMAGAVESAISARGADR